MYYTVRACEYRYGHVNTGKYLRQKFVSEA
jgi:hypothetical protein